MRRTDLVAAVREARRFIERAEAALKQVETEYSDRAGLPAARIEYTKESAAAKRASMDLTRALAKARNPR